MIPGPHLRIILRTGKNWPAFGVALREVVGIRIGIGIAIAVEIEWEQALNCGANCPMASNADTDCGPDSDPDGEEFLSFAQALERLRCARNIT
jgi:hypothetical protein